MIKWIKKGSQRIIKQKSLKNKHVNGQTGKETDTNKEKNKKK